MSEFPNKYKTAESRVLYLVAKKGYGTFAALADELGVARQFITECLQYSLPLRYAGYLGRKFSFCPGLLSFESYLQTTCKPAGVDELLSDTLFFNAKEKSYIRDGSYIRNVREYLKGIDKEIGK
jgi:hypothetical protein